MPTASKRVYIESSVYVAVFLGPNEQDFEVAKAAIDAAEQGITRGYISGLVMAETIGAPRIRNPEGPPNPAWVERLEEAVAYFRASPFEYVEESRRAGERAMEIAAGFGLKGADALHVALAETAGCEEFYSLDGKHLRIANQLPTMRVLRPYGDPQSQIDI